jgi:hypothetical protein
MIATPGKVSTNGRGSSRRHARFGVAAVQVLGPGHVLTTLHKDRMREQIAVILQTDPDFPNAVSDEEIRGACRRHD